MNNADAWTCPFCALLCDRFQVDRSTTPPRLQGSDCPRAHDALRHFDFTAAPTAAALIDGAPATHEAALDTAAQRLSRARQPLIGGLATDVAGMRALYRLAARTGAIVDHAHGDAMQAALSALQDRGQFTTTLAEIGERADLIVCLGTQPGARFPEFWRRCRVGEADSPLRRVVFVGVDADARLGAPTGVAIDRIDGDDLHVTLALLNAQVGGRRPRELPMALATLAEQLLAARYAVLVWEAGTLPAQGALLVEVVQRLVNELNRRTRAASFALGGNDGAATAQQVVTWLSGLPLRTRVSRDALEHEPLRFGATRLLGDRAVDALLWVASFGPQLPPPAAALPRIVLGHPALAQACSGADNIFIPVATPGIDADGHLFRLDGVVALPLVRVRDGALPGVAAVASAIAERLA